VSMMGNALIQPTMYFNLRYVPMFSGPYMITSVTHNISPGKFETTFEGIRQPVASLPKIDNYLQSLKTNLLESIKNQLNSSQQPNQTPPKNTNANSNVQSQTADASNQANTQDSTTINSGSSAACEPLSAYAAYTKLDNPSTFTLTTQQIVNKVVSIAPGNDLLQTVLFCTIYMASKKPNDTNTYVGVENNYMGISIDKNKQTESWGASSSFFKNNYYCSSTNVAYATFQTVDNNIKFLSDRWKNRLGGYSKTKESIANFWILNNDTSKTRNATVYQSMNQTEKTEIENKIQKAIDLFNQTPK